jgi:DNA-binding transcriptional regulator GbsR (MarR family)
LRRYKAKQKEKPMNLSERKKEIIERIGVAYEKKGLQPVVGRIMGLLLVAEPAEATFEEIQEELQVSKSAVSTALTFLQAKETVEYTTKPGERKRYFKLRLKDWRSELKKEFDEVLNMEDLIIEIIELKENQKSDLCCRLLEMKDFFGFMRKELPLLLKKFEATRK